MKIILAGFLIGPKRRRSSLARKADSFAQMQKSFQRASGDLSDLIGLNDYRIRGSMAVLLLIVFMISVGSGIIPKIDSSQATLIVGFVGAYSVARQAQVGFANLIEAQKQRGEIEAEARLDQHRLTLAASKEQRLYETHILVSGLAGEIFGIMIAADAQQKMDRACGQLYGAYKGTSTNKVNIPSPQFSDEFYKNNVSKVGILGASIAGDLIKVYSSKPYIIESKDISMSGAEMLYSARALYLRSWLDDLAHVHRRLMALIVPGLRDPGPLPLAGKSTDPTAGSPENPPVTPPAA